MKADIQVDTTLTETTGFIDLSKTETLDQLEKLLAKAIHNEINAALTKTQQEYRSDVFGFGEALHRKDPQLWKEIKGEWTDLFPHVEVQVIITARISRTGMITKPIKVVH